MNVALSMIMIFVVVSGFVDAQLYSPEQASISEITQDVEQGFEGRTTETGGNVLSDFAGFFTNFLPQYIWLHLGVLGALGQVGIMIQLIGNMMSMGVLVYLVFQLRAGFLGNLVQFGVLATGGAAVATAAAQL